ncbi:zinc finger C2HC domain-containing protein 1C [Trichonephila inaurata madagascariensis]|uniref:Zinc finger C2HC domain-containing protein 1C n=1 Tax=Trichonephila inaurata madagascariensis TaxID=2747483 RepID=A0A8X6JR83_9ARAC|nr:zinc finger C2HC domain-containing protein 1C [Trichonephila inaurata madagascariensis]
MPSKLEQMQLQFRQRLKEEQMIKIHTDNQQKALSKVSKYNGIHTTTVQTTITAPKPQPAIVPPQPHHSPIKKGSPGVDRSRPLPPISKEPRNASSSRSSPIGGAYENGSKISMSFNSRSRSVDQEQRYISSRPVQNGTRVPPKNGFSRPLNFEPKQMEDPEPKLMMNPEPKQLMDNEPKLLMDPEPKLFMDPEPKLLMDPEPKELVDSAPKQVVTLEPKKSVNVETKPMCQPEKEPVKKTEAVPGRKLTQEAKTKLKQAELQRLRANTKPREDASSRNGVNNTSSRSSPERRKTTTRPSNPVAAPSRPRPRAQAAAVSTTARKPAATSNKPASRAAPSANNKAGDVPRKPPGPGQEQCTVCGRNFNQDRIEKHRSICKKVTSKKVKVFDATKMRVKGTEAEQFVRKGVPKNEPKQAKKSDWRKKHNDFIEAIRQAKMVQQHLAKGGKVSDLPPPPPSDTSDYVPCPHCGRKFNEGVAERHIPKCKNIVSNKKNPVPSRRK